MIKYFGHDNIAASGTRMRAYGFRVDQCAEDKICEYLGTETNTNGFS